MDKGSLQQSPCVQVDETPVRYWDPELPGRCGQFGEHYFTTPQYDSLPGKHPHSATIIDRFGSWKKALALVGLHGGTERRHTAEQLIQNLETVWRELGFPPGKRRIALHGAKISESPYKRVWGSVRRACEALASFKDGSISRDQLLSGGAPESRFAKPFR